MSLFDKLDERGAAYAAEIGEALEVSGAADPALLGRLVSLVLTAQRDTLAFCIEESIGGRRVAPQDDLLGGPAQIASTLGFVEGDDGEVSFAPPVD